LHFMAEAKIMQTWHRKARSWTYQPCKIFGLLKGIPLIHEISKGELEAEKLKFPV
jgi:hypothetical protein